VVSFLASRAAPAGGFWIALAGGVALAREAERRGARVGFGTSIAAMLETVAIIGPIRFGIPLTQAISAPMLGRLEARGWGTLPQVLACAAVRVVHNSATTAFFIWVITGGLDAYAGTYDFLGGLVGLDVGVTGALVLTAATLLGWAAFASTIQVLIYRRGLAGWDEEAALAAHESAQPVPDPAPEGSRRPRFDPRAVALAAAVAFALLLSGTAWLLLAAVGTWLAVAWATSRPDNSPVPAGLVLATTLAGGALLFSLGGGLGLEEALRRALRAALIVMVATWLRAAAGAVGLREVSRRTLGRLRRLPAMPEAVRALDQITSEGRLAAAARTLAARFEHVAMRPLPLVDAMLGWVVREAAAFRAPPGPAAPPRLRVRALDLVLVGLALVPAAALAT
jgi:hypothetical protein